MDSMSICPGLGMFYTDSLQIIIPPPSCKIPSLLKFKHTVFIFFISLPMLSISLHVILPPLFYTLAHASPSSSLPQFLLSQQNFRCPCRKSQTQSYGCFILTSVINPSSAHYLNCTLDLANLSVNKYLLNIQTMLKFGDSVINNVGMFPALMDP